jgi:hypothetical protein
LVVNNFRDLHFSIRGAPLPGCLKSRPHGCARSIAGGLLRWGINARPKACILQQLFRHQPHAFRVAARRAAPLESTLAVSVKLVHHDKVSLRVNAPRLELNLLRADQQHRFAVSVRKPVEVV